MLKTVILFFILFLLSSYSVHSARQLSLTSNKNTFSLNEEMMVTASASGFTNGEKVYLKGAFYKEGSSNYFGFTRFNDSWIKNSATALSQKEVIMGNWDNQTVVKLDYEDSGFTGTGDYKFKLGFYYFTSSGNLSSVNWSSNSLDILVNSEPSPAPEPEYTTDNESSSYEESKKISNSPTLKPTEKVTITSKATSGSDKITNVVREASSYAQIKPIVDTKKEDKGNDEVQVLGTKGRNLPSVFLISGIFLFAVSIFMILKRELKRRNIL